MSIFILLISGLFLGWSLGANDAANVFGTAVGSRMVRFRTAAMVCAVFIILGATFGGGGTTRTLSRLGEINALGGAFTVALAAALATFWMTRWRIPISTSQSIVGAIIGWNLYAGRMTDSTVLRTIVLTWVASPLLSGVVAALLYLGVRRWLRRACIHLLRLDQYTRAGLILAGAFGSYSLGANNIANVMGVFLPDNPFRDLTLLGVTISGGQLLFLLGGLAIAAGVFTYSERVMRTVGAGVVRLSPVAALVVVLAHSITLFLFASEGLENLLSRLSLPTIPLVPVSSSQAVIGAIIGIGLVKGRRGIRGAVLGKIGAGWLATPLLAGVIAFFLLFFVENVFDQQVARDIRYRIDQTVLRELESEGVPVTGLSSLLHQDVTNSQQLQAALLSDTELQPRQVGRVLELARLDHWHIDPPRLAQVAEVGWLSPGQLAALRALSDRHYERNWLMHKDLAERSAEWQPLPQTTANHRRNRELERKLAYLDRVFLVN